MNNITVYGRLGRDCQQKEVNGKKLLELNVCQCQRKNEEAEGKSPVWWQVSYWGDKYDKLTEYLKKGSAVIVSGEMSYPECYQTKAAGWNVSLKIRGNDLKFNPFGSAKTEEPNKDSEEKVVYPHEFNKKPESKGADTNADLGDLF